MPGLVTGCSVVGVQPVGLQSIMADVEEGSTVRTDLGAVVG